MTSLGPTESSTSLESTPPPHSDPPSPRRQDSAWMRSSMHVSGQFLQSAPLVGLQGRIQGPRGGAYIWLTDTTLSRHEK
jgi:hypothetical protein